MSKVILWLINRIQNSVGDFLTCFFGASAMLTLGTAISLNIMSCFKNPWLTLICLPLVCAICAIFLRTTSVLSHKEYLPHMFDSTNNAHSIRLGLPPLLLAAAAQIAISDFHPRILLGVFITSLLPTVAILFWSLSLHFLQNSGLARHKQTSEKNLLLGILSAIIAILSICGFMFVLITKFALREIPSYIVGLTAFGLMLLIRYYYERITKKLAVDLDEIYLAKPSSTRAYVLVSKFNQPTIRAISYARTSNDNLEILTIQRTSQSADKIQSDWKRAKIDVPLRIISTEGEKHVDLALKLSEFIKSTTNFTNGLNSRSLTIIYLPHYVSKHWWEHFLHNRAVKRVVKELDKLPSVVISSVPFQRA